MNANATRTDFKFHVIALLTIIVWGTTFISTKVLINHGLSPVEIFLYRFLLAYVCIWFFAPKILWAKNVKDELLFLLLGLCGGSLYFVTENTALSITLAANVCVLYFVHNTHSDRISILCHLPQRQAYQQFIIGFSGGYLGCGPGRLQWQLHT